MTRDQFLKGLIELAKRDKEFAAIGAYEMLTPRQVSVILNVPIASLRKMRQGTEVLMRINVSCHDAKQPRYQFNKREVIGLLRIRQQPKPSARERAAEIYAKVVGI
jgi:hypothetical protein